MSNMNGLTRKKLYPLIANRDGEYCRCCGVLSHERQLVIDHRNNDNSNNNLINLQLLCRTCNYLKNPRRPVDECVSEYDEETELTINRTKEPNFRKYVLHEINERDEVTVDELIYSGSEDIGISPETAKRYLKKMFSSRGILERIIRVKTPTIRYKKNLGM